jgi:hypothetical protein
MSPVTTDPVSFSSVAVRCESPNAATVSPPRAKSAGFSA